MPSQYRPQVFGWSHDLGKNISFIAKAGKSVNYMDRKYCEVVRENLAKRISYGILAFILLITIVVLLSASIPAFIFIIKNPDPKEIDFVFILIFVCILLWYTLLMFAIPEFLKNTLAPFNSPIWFNRKTLKVYICDSYFANFKIFKNPLHIFRPFKQKINEYDWDDIQGVIMSFPRPPAGRFYHTLCMVCKPGTRQTYDHFILNQDTAHHDPRLWYWICRYMEFDDHELHIKKPFKPAPKPHFLRWLPFIAPDARWPQWMIEAKSAESLQALIAIKKRYGIDASADKQRLNTAPFAGSAESQAREYRKILRQSKQKQTEQIFDK